MEVNTIPILSRSLDMIKKNILTIVKIVKTILTIVKIVKNDIKNCKYCKNPY